MLKTATTAPFSYVLRVSFLIDGIVQPQLAVTLATCTSSRYRFFSANSYSTFAPAATVPKSWLEVSNIFAAQSCADRAEHIPKRRNTPTPDLRIIKPSSPELFCRAALTP